MSDYIDKVLFSHDVYSTVSRELGFKFSYTSNDLIPLIISKSQDLTRFGACSWYYEFVSRGRAIYISHGNSIFFSIAPSWTRGVNNSHSNSFIILRPHYKKEVEDLFVEWIRLVSNKLGKIILKQLDENQKTSLIKKGFREYHNNEKWDKNAVFDDQTYPEVLLNAQNIDTLPESYARNTVKEDIEKRRYTLVHKKEMLINMPSTKECLLSVFYCWVRQFKQRHSDIIDEHFITWHLLAFETIVDNDETEIYFLWDKFDGLAVGVFALSKNANKQIDVIFSFISEEQGNIQRVAYGWLLSKVNGLNYRWANLGGSEKKSLFDFKKSLGQYSLLNTSHLIFNGD